MNEQELADISAKVNVEQAERILAETIKRTIHDDAVCYQYTLTNEGVSTMVKTCGAEYLKNKGWSMRNIRGEWIK